MPSTLLLDVGPAVGGHGARGIGRYVRGLVAAIEAMDPSLRDRVWAYGAPSSAVAAFSDRGLTLPWPLRPPQAPSWLSGRLASGWALARSRAGALHATDPHRPWAPRTARSAVTVYDLIPLREPSLLASLRPDHRWMYRRYLEQVRSSTRVIAISRATASDVVERLGFDEERIDIVYPVVEAPRVLLRQPSAEPVFIVVGALDPHKRPELALDAFALYRQRVHAGRLRFIGPADHSAIARVRSAVERGRLEHVVTIEGRIPDPELAKAYRTATALVSASRDEGFGLPPVEAALRGTPVVVVDSDVARETVGEAAVLVPADAEAIAFAMESGQPPSEDVISRLSRRFSAEAAARALESSYGRLLDGSPRAARAATA